MRNHREVIATFDYFTVPTVTFKLIYCFFVIEHSRRKILHFNVTCHPTAEWIVQQFREAFPEAVPYQYVILDHDSKFNDQVIQFLRATGLEPKRTSVQAPWQNGVAERWIGSCRREVLDHVIVLDEQHLRRLVRDYVSYYHEDALLHFFGDVFYAGSDEQFDYLAIPLGNVSVQAFKIRRGEVAIWHRITPTADERRWLDITSTVLRNSPDH